MILRILLYALMIAAMLLALYLFATTDWWRRGGRK